MLHNAVRAQHATYVGASTTTALARQVVPERVSHWLARVNAMQPWYPARCGLPVRRQRPPLPQLQFFKL